MTAINNFIHYYLAFNQRPIDDLDDIYSVDVAFSDPVHRIQGVESLKHYFSSMCDNLISCHFEFLEQNTDGCSIWFTWNIHFQHPQLRRGQPLVVPGATRLTYDSDSNKITAHEDFYDMGAMLYEHTPILGRCVRWLKQRIIDDARICHER